jgi:hypothetical protein
MRASPERRSEDAPRGGSSARIAILLALAALTVLLAWRQESSTDLGFHLAAGHWILEHGTWPQVDSFTWTLAGRPYVDMNGLFQVALWLAYRGGMVGVGLLKVAFALATFGVLWISSRSRGVESPALLGIGFAIALLTWEQRLMPRPELVSGLCLAAQLYLLRRHQDTRDPRFLLATVPLELLWVYSHSLSFFGVAVLGMYAVTRWRTAGFAPWLALAVATVVLFLNPYGVRGVAWQWSLGPRATEGTVFADFIGELWSPFSTLADRFPALLFFKLMLAATVVALVAGARRVSLFDWVVVVFFGALAAMKMRFVAMFAIVALPVALEAASARIGRALERRTATVATLIAIALACQQTISGGLYAYDRYPFRFGYIESPAVFPVGTVRTLEASSLGGPLFNPIQAGGYLEQHRPGEKTFVDGRLEVMDEDFYRAYLGATMGGDWDALDNRWHPTLALVPATARRLVRHLLDEPGWALVDVDAVSFLFARSTPDHLQTIEASRERFRRLDAPAPATGEAISPPPRRSWFARSFGSKNVPFEAFGRGVNFLQVGMIEAARRELRQALLTSDQPEPALVKSYVVALADLGRQDEAVAWCRWLVELAPQDKEARALLVKLESSGS